MAIAIIQIPGKPAAGSPAVWHVQDSMKPIWLGEKQVSSINLVRRLTDTHGQQSHRHEWNVSIILEQATAR